MKVRIGFVSNSSSEAFICKTDKSIEQIEVELRELLDIYNKLTKQNYQYDEVFGSIVDGDTNDARYLREYLGYYDEFNKPNVDLDGKVIIYSASDNTIPWALFEIIEEAYNANRIHMG